MEYLNIGALLIFVQTNNVYNVHMFLHSVFFYLYATGEMNVHVIYMTIYKYTTILSGVY